MASEALTVRHDNKRNCIILRYGVVLERASAVLPRMEDYPEPVQERGGGGKGVFPTPRLDRTATVTSSQARQGALR